MKTAFMILVTPEQNYMRHGKFSVFSQERQLLPCVTSYHMHDECGKPVSGQILYKLTREVMAMDRAVLQSGHIPSKQTSKPQAAQAPV